MLYDEINTLIDTNMSYLEIGCVFSPLTQLNITYSHYEHSKAHGNKYLYNSGNQIVTLRSYPITTPEASIIRC